jgi:NADH dehydrogenase
VGTLEFRAAIEPVRRLAPAEFHQAWATDVDIARKVVRVQPHISDDVAVPGEEHHQEAFEVPYDKLVLAVGCYSQTFGIEGVAEHACFLRDVGDARAIRLRTLQAFEKAALPTTSEAERRRLLHFAVVGGGPTGIEFAAELHDLVHEDLARLYPGLMQHVTITIYDIAPKVLPMFDRRLADYATETFRRQGIRVKTEHHLECIRRDGDHLLIRMREEPDEVAAGLVVWSTGLMQNPLVRKLVGRDLDLDGVGTRIAKDPRTGGFLTDENLRVQVTRQGDDGRETTSVLPDVFAVGDCAVVEGQKYPATAQVASQQAVHLGRGLNSGTPEAKPFRFRNLGTMAYLGSWRAIHQSKADELTGRAAWILWRTAYLTKSMSIRNKILIPVYWAITWIFGRDISRF